MRSSHALSFALLLPLAACSVSASPETDEGAYTSASATLLDFEFDGEVTTTSLVSGESAIHDQMLFSIGQLNGETGVGRLDKLVLSNVKTTPIASGSKITYHAILPVSLSKMARVKDTYEIVVPRAIDWSAQEAFFQKYEKTRCTDVHAHDNETGIYWYYYRPGQSGCALDAADVLRLKAKVTVSKENAVDTYPEYDQIWSDKTLTVVSIFGKVEDGATTESDRGIWSHSQFVATMRKELPNAKTIPAALPARVGIEFPDVTIESTLADGRKVRLVSLLVDNVREGGPEFEARYNALSTDADVIAYNGHAGLGQNVRKLASLGKFKSGKYQIVYMNGCDTFAYVDGSLAATRAKLNPDDPTGTKYMEFLTNSMPPNWDALPNNTMALTRDLIGTPKKYADILAGFDNSGFVVVTGDEDNRFKPAN